MKKLLLLCTLLILTVSSLAAQEPVHDNIPENCEYPDAPYYQQGLFVRYRLHAHQIQLVDWITGDIVQIIEDTMDHPLFGFYVREWSKDCRYVAMLYDETDAYIDGDLVVWDTVDQRYVARLDDTRIYDVIWSADSRQIALKTNKGKLLWHLSDGSTTELDSTQWKSIQSGEF